MAFVRHREGIRRWLVRYGPAEVIGTTSAYLGSSLVFAATHNEITAAYGGVVSELLGFYGTIIARDVIAELRSTASRSGERRLWRFVRTIRRALGRMVVEFAPAELLDASVVRPLAMGVGTSLLGRAWGVAGGKVCSDLAFYAVVFSAQALRRRRERLVASS